MAVDSDNDEVTPPAGLTLATAATRPHLPRLLLAGVAALLLVATVAAARSGNGGGAHSGPSHKPGLAAPAGAALAEPKALPATSFDPEGDDEENQATVALVADGDPGTAWKTDRYNDNFPKLKSGVGFYIDLGRSQKIRSVNLNAAPGYNAEIFVADKPTADLAGWGKARAAGGNDTFSLNGAPGRYVLVWFTSLPAVDGGYKAEVSEITVAHS
jgi:hypothetical protein